MKRTSIKILFSILIIFSNYHLLYSQETATSNFNLKSLSEKKIFPAKNFHTSVNENEPILFLYLGMGLAPGGRVGAMAFVNQFSIEAFIGKDWRNFIALSDDENRMGIGVGYHLESLPIIINFNFVYAVRPEHGYPRLRNPKYFYGINAGYFVKEKKKINFLIRGGFYVEYYKDYYSQSITLGGVKPNLDIVVGWNF